MHPTRQKLLDTGLAIATDKGLRGLTVRELAAAAEVNLGTFVYHFGNREGLVRAAHVARLVHATDHGGHGVVRRAVSAVGANPCSLVRPVMPRVDHVNAGLEQVFSASAPKT